MAKDNFCTLRHFSLSQPQVPSNQGQICSGAILLRTNINTLVHSVFKTIISAGNSPEDLLNLVFLFNSFNSFTFVLWGCPGNALICQTNVYTREQYVQQCNNSQTGIVLTYQQRVITVFPVLSLYYASKKSFTTFKMASKCCFLI